VNLGRLTQYGGLRARLGSPPANDDVSQEPSDISGRLRIAVVIATVHRPDDVVRAVESVLACTYPSFEVLVVDQSSNGAAAADLGRYEADGRIRRLAVAEPRLSRALNTGAATTDADVVAITGDDCVVPADWLDCVERVLVADEAVVVAFGSVRAGPCDPQEGFVPGCVIEREVLAKSVEDIHELSGTTACMLLRTDAWRALGGFDESLGLGGPLRSGEDLDLALRALRAGKHVLQTPAVEVEHLTPVTWSERRGVVRRNWYGSGAAFAKALKLAPGPTARALGRLASRWRGGGSGVAVTYGTKPARGAMLVGFGSGFLVGLLWPISRRTGMFRRFR
jgi:cellulose synthase/poly-beta-1,6-N-acetylglucosamine synthase-like glycosyltransferase